MKRIYWILGIVLVILIAGGLAIRAVAAGRSQTTGNVQTAPVTRGTVATTISGAGQVRSNQNALINWQTSGKVGSVKAGMGQQVQANDVLANLDPSSLPTSIIQAQADLISAQTAMDDLKKPQPLKIAQAQTALDNAKTALDNLLHPSETAISQAQIAVQDAQSGVDTAKKHIVSANITRGTQQTIAAAQAAYVIAKQEVARLETAYKKIKGDPAKDGPKALALSQLQAAKVKATQAFNNLNYVSGKYTQAEIDQRNTDLALAQAQLADAQDTLAKLQNPTAQDIALAQATVNDAQQTLDTAKNGATADDLTVAQTRVILAKAALAQAALTAPFPGVITEVQVMTGDIVAPGEQAFRIDDLSKLYVDLQVSEVDIHQIQPGQAASLTFDAIPDKEYNGTVSYIGMVGTSSQGVVNYPVTVQISDADSSVLPGMTAGVNITIAEHANVLVVPNQAIRAIGGQRAVTVLFEGQQIQVPVQVGLVGDTMTEVTSNSLKEGDEVVINTSTSTITNRNNGGGFGGGFGGPGFIDR